jgi:hypothetical protein
MRLKKGQFIGGLNMYGRIKLFMGGLNYLSADALSITDFINIMESLC